MQSMTLPWHKLGLPAGRGGTFQDLKTYYGGSWSALSKYFLPTKRLATTIECPNPGGLGCPRVVVEHSFHDIVAVCGNSPKECESVPLSREDLIIYELKFERLLADVASSLQIKGTAPIQFMPMTWQLGTYAAQSQPLTPVYISLQSDPDKLQVAAISLITQKVKPFVLLVPSRDICPVQLTDIIGKVGMHLVGLDELQEVQNKADRVGLLGKYVCSEPPGMVEENTFQLENEYCRIRFLEKPYTIKQSVGLQYITELIKMA